MSLVVASSPGSLVEVADQMSAVEAYVDRCDSIPELRDISHRCAAIDEYLKRTSIEGRSRVAAALRRIEVRIGVLLGPAPTPQESGARKGSIAIEPSSDLSPDQRRDFRDLAAHPDIVEHVIAESTDEQPASRRKVLDAIRNPKPASPGGPTVPKRSPLPAAADKAGWELRRAAERIQRIAADDRFPTHRDQVAAHLRSHLTYALEVCQDLLEGLTQQPQED